MIGLIFSILLIPTALAVFARAARTIREMMAYGATLPTETAVTPPISLIKPVYGADAYTEGNFQSWAGQHYDGRVQHIYSFQRQDDPALPLAEQTGGEVIINPILPGYSGKMSNVKHGLETAVHDFIVMSDSDTRAGPDTLRRIVALYGQGAEFITCLTRYRDADNLWGRIYAAFWNFEQIGFLAPAIRRDGRKAIGNTIATTKETLAKMGGLEAFRDYVAEDVAMGIRAHELGIKVALGPMIDSPVGAMSVRELLNKFSRAALFGATMKENRENIRYVVLYSYLLTGLAGLLLLSPSLLILSFALAVIRLGLANRIWFITTGEKRLFWEAFLMDGLFLYVFFKSIFSKKTTWAGIEYRVLADGRMEKV